MARKVFISVLGTGYYEKAKYYFNNDPTQFIENRFVQVPTISHFCKNWGSDDAIFVFLTKGAKETNWAKDAQLNNSKGSYPGLSVELQNLNLAPGLIKPIYIKDGNTELEIWEIFTAVFDQLEVKDDIYLDITHAFRSIPMLLMVLINYAKFLKSIRVRSITYGNWEIGKENHGLSPIIDVTSFSVLLDWAAAAQEFTSFGRLSMTVDVLTQPLNELSKIYKGSNESLTKLRHLVSNLESVPESIYTSRGKTIYSGVDVAKFYETWDKYPGDFFPPLNPILNKINERMKGFIKSNSILNGFEAVNWCIANSWVQQGYTLLLETVISYILDEIGNNWEQELIRNILMGCTKIISEKIPENEWKGYTAENPEITKSFLEEKLVHDFTPIIVSLGAIRNDMNHAGIRNNPSNVKTLKKRLPELYFDVMAIIVKYADSKNTER